MSEDKDMAVGLAFLLGLFVVGTILFFKTRQWEQEDCYSDCVRAKAQDTQAKCEFFCKHRE